MQAKLILSLLMVLTLTACGGGGAEIQSTTTTMGQELMDLNESYKQGILTKDEYDDAKESIMERYDQ